MSLQRSALSRVWELTLTSTSGICAPAGRVVSARAERISVTRSTSQPISASASGAASPAPDGHAASARTEVRAGPSAPLIAQSSSVM